MKVNKFLGKFFFTVMTALLISMRFTSLSLADNTTNGTATIVVNIGEAGAGTSSGGLNPDIVTTTTSPSGAGTTSATTPPTTTTTVPPSQQTVAVTNIAAGQTGTFTFTKTDLLVTEVSVTVANSVSSVSVSVSQSSSVPTGVSIAAPNTIYSYLTVEKTNIQDADVTAAKIKFKVTKAWISENSIDESTVALQRYSSGAWTSLSTAKVSEDALYVYFEAESSGLSYFAITAEKVTTTTTTVPTTATTLPTLPSIEPLWIAIIAVIIIAVFVLWKFGIIKF